MRTDGHLGMPTPRCLIHRRFHEWWHTTTNKNGTQINLIYLIEKRWPCDIRVIRQISILFTRENFSRQVHGHEPMGD
jgi:hypothetical protein